MLGSSTPQSLHEYDSENDQRQSWAPLGCIDIASMSAYIQDAHYSACAKSEHADLDSSFVDVALFAPDRKQLQVCQAMLDLGSHNSSRPVGANRQGSAKHQPRRVSNAVDQTHQFDAPSPTGQPVLAAQQDQSGQARLLQSGAEQNKGTSSQQQRGLCRIGSTTGSTQFATPLLGGEGGRQADHLKTDAPSCKGRDKLKPPDSISCTNPGQRPAGHALSKLESVKSRSNPFLSTPAAIAPGQGKPAVAPAKAGQHVIRKAARKRFHVQSPERPAHTAGPSRLGSSKSMQPAAMQSTVPAVSAHADSKTDTRPSSSGPASGVACTQGNSAALKGQAAEQKASARQGSASNIPCNENVLSV